MYLLPRLPLLPSSVVSSNWCIAVYENISRRAFCPAHEKNIPVATHAQCVEKRVARYTKRKEIFEINHGSRQQVYRLLHHLSSCIQRVVGDSSEIIHIYIYICVHTFSELPNMSRIAEENAYQKVWSFFSRSMRTTRMDLSVITWKNLDFDVSCIFVSLRIFHTNCKWKYSHKRLKPYYSRYY